MRLGVKLRAFLCFFVVLICAISSVHAQNPAVFGHNPNDINWSQTINAQIKAEAFCIGNSCITSSNIGTGGGGGGGMAIGWAMRGNNLSNTNTGNVGIGTASPTLKLHVNSTDPSNYTAQFENQNGRVGIGINNGVAALTTDRPSFFIADITSHKLRTRAPGTGSHDLMLLQTGGNGLGDIASIVWVDSNGAEKARILQAGAGHTLRFLSAGPMYFNTNAIGVTATNTRMVIDANGNVGIGREGPRRKLDVAGQIVIDVPSGAEHPSAAILFLQNSAPKWYIGNLPTGLSEADGLAIGGNDSVGNKLVILQSGNVGINTSSPQATLDVRGSASIGNYANLGEDSYETPWHDASVVDSDTCPGTDATNAYTCTPEETRVCIDIQNNNQKRNVNCVQAMAGVKMNTSGIVIDNSVLISSIKGTNPTCPAGASALMIKRTANSCGSRNYYCSTNLPRWCDNTVGWNIATAGCTYYVGGGLGGTPCTPTICPIAGWTEALCIGSAA